MKISFGVMTALIAVLGACTSLEVRTKSQSSGNREAAVHYFMYRAAKTDADRIAILFNHPKLETRYDTHQNLWQLDGTVSFFNYPISVLIDTFALPFDASAWKESLPKESIQNKWGNRKIEKIRVFHLAEGKITDPETRIYENNRLETMEIINELLETLPSAGTLILPEIGNVPQYRIEMFDSEGSRYFLEDYENYIEAPITLNGRFYEETFARETALRRLIENIERLPGTYELTSLRGSGK